MLWGVLGAVLASALAPEVDTRTWNTADGLPQSSVTAIAQGPEGALYLGTFAGVARFDGRTFETVDPSADAGWSGLRVTALATTEGGGVWLGVQDGRLIRVENGSFTVAPTPALFEDRAIWSLSFDEGVVWAAGPLGVAGFDGHAWRVIEDTQGANVVFAHGGKQWMGGHDGLFRLSQGEKVAVPAGIGAVSSLCVSHGDLIAGGENGVVRVGPGGVTRIDDRGTARLLCAADGTIWSASGDEIRALNTDLTLRIGQSVRVLFEDRERNIWVGSDGGGLTRIIREDWKIIDIPGGALPIVQLSDDSMLVGAFCGPGGLYRIPVDGETMQITAECVRALAPEGTDVLVGLDDEVLRWSEDEGFRVVVDAGHPILALEPTVDGIWIGTDTGGAMLFRDGVLESVEAGDARVLSVAAEDDAVWFGTHRGLSRLDAEGLTRWTHEDGVPPGPIRGLLLDPDGTVFMASYGGGLGVLRDGEFSRLTAAEGLSDNALSSVVDDGVGSLWLNGNRGLSRVAREDLGAWLGGTLPNPRVRRWGTPEGNGGGQRAGVRLDDGTLAFSTTRGLVTISPSTVFRNPVQPRVLLHAADVDGVPLDPAHAASVPPGAGRGHVEFSAATLRHPELATLEYRLVDSDVTQAGPWMLAGDGTLVWGGVVPGEHVVELRATNEDGVHSEPLRLAFELAPHIHQRWTFWAGVAGFFLAIGAAAHTWRTRFIAEKNRALEREVQQRIAAEEEQRMTARRLAAAERMEAVGRLAGGIAHDFNNLLTAVAGTSAVLRGLDDEGGCDVNAKPLLDSLDRCVERGAGLTRSLLSFARQQPMAPAPVDGGTLVRNLLPMLETSVRDDVSLRVSLPAEPIGLHVDPALLELALINLVLNAQAALGQGGCVTLELECLEADELAGRFGNLLPEAEGAWVVVSVHDDGEGMSAEVLARAREPFFTSREQGNGLGLPSVEGFAEQSGGAMHLVSTLGEGTSVSLVLPFCESPGRAGPAAPEPAPIGGGGQVLLCDDDELVRSSLVRVLERAGYSTRSFSDPRELLAWLETGAGFDILVTDVLMPGMTGDALADRVVALRPGTPVVFMSGYTDDIRTESLAGTLLSKPFGSQDVIRAVEEALADAD